MNPKFGQRVSKAKNIIEVKPRRIEMREIIKPLTDILNSDGVLTMLGFNKNYIYFLMNDLDFMKFVNLRARHTSLVSKLVSGKINAVTKLGVVLLMDCINTCNKKNLGLFRDTMLLYLIFQTFSLLSLNADVVRMVEGLNLDFSKRIDLSWAIALVSNNVSDVVGAVVIPLHSGVNKNLVLIIGPTKIVEGVKNARNKLRWVGGSR